MQKRFPQRFRAEILTPSACCTILSRLRLRLSTRLTCFPLAGGLKAREGVGTDVEREDEERTAASQASPGSIHVVPVAVDGAGRGVRAHWGWQEVECAGHPLATW